MKAKIPEGLDLILKNNTAGSTELLRMLNSFFLKNQELEPEFPHYIALASSGKLRTFAAVQNYLKDFELVLRNNNAAETRSFLLGFENSLVSFYQRLYENAKPAIGSFRTVITISNSYTLTQVFRLWKQDNPELKVIVPESRTKREGRIFARNLLGYGLSVEFITEAMIAEFTLKADAAIIGADMLLSNGNAVNKSGSRLLALSAGYYKKPFIVITGKDKLSPAVEYTPEDYPPEELWEFRDGRLKVTNHYFEEVEKELITMVITG